MSLGNVLCNLRSLIRRISRVKWQEVWRFWQHEQVARGTRTRSTMHITIINCYFRVIKLYFIINWTGTNSFIKLMCWRDERWVGTAMASQPTNYFLFRACQCLPHLISKLGLTYNFTGLTVPNPSRYELKTQSPHFSPMRNGVFQGSLLSVYCFFLIIDVVVWKIPLPSQYRLFFHDLSITLRTDCLEFAMNLLQFTLRIYFFFCKRLYYNLLKTNYSNKIELHKLEWK